MGSRERSRTVSRVVSPVGDVLGIGFTAAAILRRGKPIHPRGAVGAARLVRFGSRGAPWGVRWLDEPGVDVGIARFSRSLGLPGPLPDVLGLALRLQGRDAVHDLLLATTGLRVGLRHVLIPQRDALAASYGSLLPYDAAGRRILLAVTPAAASRPGRTSEQVADALAERPAVFAVLVASMLGAWQQVGSLEIGRDVGSAGPLDTALRFDPVINPPPGLPPTLEHAAVRFPAYLDSRLATSPATD